MQRTTTGNEVAGETAARHEARGRKRGTGRDRGPRAARALLLAPVGLFCATSIYLGWRTRDEYYFVAEEGLGYALGWVGLGMMLLLLLYSARKRWLWLGRAGGIQHWFHVHMALGLLGPTAILFHSNFSLGSLNANVALFCMLTVSLSGIVGRFIYTRIHLEYRGRVASFAELRAQASSEGGILAAAMGEGSEAAEILDAHRRWAFADRSLPGRLGMMCTIGVRGRRARGRVMRAVRAAARRSGTSRSDGRALRRAVKAQLRAIKRVAEYSVYERFFALWHALHLPFCVGLFAAAAVHVVAVHMY